MSAPKLVLLVPDGVGVRNFLHSSFLARWRELGDVLVWHDLPDRVVELLPDDRGRGGDLRFERLPPAREPAAARVLRLAKGHAGLLAHAERGTEAVLRLTGRSGSLRGRAVVGLARWIGRLSSTPSGVRRLDRLHARAAARQAVLAAHRAVLDAARPDVLFCTHQRASRAVPAMLAARAAGIPAATFVYSWDNLPKGRMAVHADRYLVWSDGMARDLLRYHPEADPRQVRVVGTPQFEPYFDRLLRRRREAFLGRLGIDPARRAVLFSGDDAATSPHDPLYLRDLAVAVAALPETERPRIVFRRCPPDVSGRYDEVLRAHPEIAVAEPAWERPTGGDWTQVLPRPEDRLQLANLVAHCDAVVNLGSTMGMDFAIAGKPAVWVAYDPVRDSRWTASDVYRLPHFAAVHRLQPVHRAARPADLGPALRSALDHPEAKAAARAAWIRETVAEPVDGASERTVEALLAIAAEVAR